MDLNLAQKLIKYNHQDIQSVTYVVEYAQHNYEGDAVQKYINERLTGKTQREIAAIVLETALANTINAKPSAASGKIETPKEKPSTEGSTSAAMKSIEAKGDAKKAGYKGGVEGTGTNVVQKEEVTVAKDMCKKNCGCGQTPCITYGEQTQKPAAARPADKVAVAEHHEKDADGNVIPHEVPEKEIKNEETNTEETSMESRVDRVRRMLAIQETFEKDREELKDPKSSSWRARVGIQEEQATPEQLKKRAKLDAIKKLTNSGKHKEASDAFKKEFPKF